MPEEATHTSSPEQVRQNYTLDELRELEYSLDTIDVYRLARTAPTTVADFLSRLDVDDRRAVLRKLSAPLASDILAEMDSEDSAETVGAMREHRALSVLSSLAADDAADLLGELPDEDRKRLISKLDPDTAQTIHDLLKYKHDTAGGIMNPNVATVEPDWTIDRAIEHIRELKDHNEDIFYIYVVDKQHRLIGMVPMREFVLARPSMKIREVMHTHLKGLCTPDLDREKVALMMARLNLHALPVIDTNRRLLGVVSHDDVIDVLQEEAREDMQKLVGAGGNEAVHDDIRYSLSHRTPWLIFNLMTAGLAAMVVSLFEGRIAEMAVLAVLMPVIAGVAGNSGQQTLAVFIRGLALDEIRPGEYLYLCARESLKGLLSGLVVGAIACAVIWGITRNLELAAVVWVAQTTSMMLGCFVGGAIPLLLKKLKRDPAQSSSIFLTMTTDSLGFFIFLGLATLLLF